MKSLGLCDFMDRQVHPSKKEKCWFQVSLSSCSKYANPNVSKNVTKTIELTECEEKHAKPKYKENTKCKKIL